MLYVNNLNQNGNDAQRALHLPDACSGAAICGMGMSEPGAGTDVLGMATRAAQDADGGFTLTGQKMWITNGTVDGTTTGDKFLVYARTGEGRADVSMFHVEKDMPGFTLGQKIEDKLGMRASMTAEVSAGRSEPPRRGKKKKQKRTTTGDGDRCVSRRHSLWAPGHRRGVFA